MDRQAMPQMQLLLQDEQVRDKIIFLTPTHYQEAIEWIRRHFKFAYGQQIEWSHDANAITGNMQDLREKVLLQLLRQYDVEPTRTLTVIWPMPILASSCLSPSLPGISMLSGCQ